MSNKTIPTFEELRVSLEEHGHGGERGDPNSGSDYAALLAASAIVGCGVEELCGYTGFSLDFVLPVRERMRTAGIWRDDGTVECSWMDEEDGGMAFSLDTLVGRGLMEVVSP